MKNRINTIIEEVDNYIEFLKKETKDMDRDEFFWSRCRTAYKYYILDLKKRYKLKREWTEIAKGQNKSIKEAQEK